MRAIYPSDITREQFEVIRYILESACKVTHPRTYDLYDIFCAVLYVLREGCRWRSLPHDFPKWNNVYYHYQTWSKIGAEHKSTLDKALEELVLSARVISGKEAQPSMAIVDSKSIKNTFTAEEKGYDGGEKNIRDKNTPWGRYAWPSQQYSCDNR
jgi:transposase